MSIKLHVNGADREVDAAPSTPLLYVLRNDLGLRGPRFGCCLGQCGACTVIMNGRVVYSCTVLAIDAQGKDIQTIEGINAGGKVHPVSAAFVQHDAQQSQRDDGHRHGEEIGDAQPVHRGPRREGAQHEHRRMGQIQDIQHAKDERVAESEQGIHAPQKQAVDELLHALTPRPCTSS